jgi:hypothetical protein
MAPRPPRRGASASPPPPRPADAGPSDAQFAAACSRRALLTGSAILAAGTLVGCAGMPTPAWQAAQPQPILPSPTSPQLATPQATPPPGGLGLNEFLALSSVLTGFDDLNPTLGRVYLGAAQARQDPAATLRDLYERAGFASASPPTTTDDLAAAGIFADKPLGTLADTIARYWYSGMIGEGDHQVVVTYVDALGWRSLSYGKPATICGPYSGFWRDRPPALPQG